MFKITQLLRTISRLSDQVLQNQNKKLLINTKVQKYFNNINVLFYCTNPHSNNTIEGLNENVDVNEITGGDPELEKKLRMVVLETDILKQDGSNVPDVQFLKTQHWIELLNKSSRSARRKYLTFLFKIERKKENRILKKEKKREELDNRPDYVDDGHIRYGLNHNTFLIRIYDSTMNQLYYNKLINAMKFGQKLIIDCGYDNHMISRESNNCAKQIMLMFAENRIHDDPFDLHLCNAPPDTPTIKALHRHIATMYEPWFPLNIHPSSYLDMFPKQNLVYLTPHCREELKEYDHDAIYIIGGIVDKINNEPVSLAKAKQEGLKMAKLPLDRYLQWGAGSGKSLTLNCMMNILLDIKTTANWNYALRHVPKRKISDEINQSMYKRAPRDRFNKELFNSDRSSIRYDRNYTKSDRRYNEEVSQASFNREPRERSVSQELLYSDRSGVQYDRNSSKYDKKFKEGSKRVRNKDFVKKLLENT